MGSGSSVSKPVDMNVKDLYSRKYPDLFYKGMQAAQEGKYSVAELYFHQVTEDHPGYEVINGMLNQISKCLVAIETGVSGPMGASSHGSAAKANTGNSPKTSPSLTSDKKTKQRSRENASPTSNSAGNDLQDLMTGDDPLNGEGGTSIQGQWDRFDVPFFLDKRGEDIINYQRLQQDMESVYISCNTPKAHQLAMLYAQRNCVIFQVTLHCVCDMIDERKAREQQLGSEAVKVLDDGYTDYALADARMSDKRSKFATEKDIELQIAQLLQHCRFFWVNSATNYGMLAMRYTEAATREASEKLGLVTSDKLSREAVRERERAKKLEQRVLWNLLENCEAIIDMIRDLALESEDEFASMVVLRLLPDVKKIRADRIVTGVDEVEELASDGVSVNHSSAHGSSKYGSSSNEPQSAEMLKARYRTLASQRGNQTHMSDSRNFSPALPVLLPLHRIRLPMRLVPTVDQSRGPALRSHLASVMSPADRNSWRYVAWSLGAAGEGLVLYPASTAFLLCKALPQHYEEGTNGAAVFRKEAIPGRQPPTRQYLDVLLDYAGKVQMPVESNETTKTSVKTKHSVVSKPNHDLDVMQPHMRALLFVDEVAVAAMPMYFLMAQVYKALGMTDLSLTMARAIVMQTACFHGPDSTDRFFIQQICRSAGLL